VSGPPERISVRGGSRLSRGAADGLAPRATSVVSTETMAPRRVPRPGGSRWRAGDHHERGPAVLVGPATRPVRLRSNPLPMLVRDRCAAWAQRRMADVRERGGWPSPGN
jgi:hypothetical protein